MGLLPWQFWRMTPREFRLHVEAYVWRDDMAWHRTAWQTAHIINHWRKEKDQVTIEDLLPQRDKQDKDPMTDEQMAENALAWAVLLGAEDKRHREGEA